MEKTCCHCEEATGRRGNLPQISGIATPVERRSAVQSATAEGGS